MTVTARDLCTDALFEIGALGAGETASSEDMALVLGKLNRLLDNWNADDAALYADQFVTYTLTPSLQPHTIGPTGTFVVTIRPEAIEGANLIVDDVRLPVDIIQAEAWEAITVPTLTSAVPLVLYYEPTYPNGAIYLWPIPTAYSLELRTRRKLAALALGDTFAMPPGYQDAITLTLAESIVSPFGAASRVAPTLVNDAGKARARIFARNDVPRPIRTDDSGLPTKRGGGFNYLIGKNV